MYLQQYTERPSSQSTLRYIPVGREEGFASLYDLESKGRDRVIHFQSVEDFKSIVKTQTSKHHKSLFFMKGLPSPEWLCAIGSHFQTDPEFFQRHMDYDLRRDHFTASLLPSTNSHFIRLPIVTIAKWCFTETPHKNFTTRSLRQKWENFMTDYVRSLKEPGRVGGSIVRGFSVFDEEHFTVEQDITIHVTYTTTGWTGKS
jgi:hypothetical protein